MDHQALRQHMECFTSLTDEQFDKAFSAFKRKSLKKHQVLIREGDYVQNTYWVIKGLLVSKFIDDQGSEIIIQFAVENCWITDQNAFYNQEKSIFRIISLEDSDLYSLSWQMRENICREIPEIGQFFLKKANDSFVKQQKRLLTYLTADAKERFDLLIKEYPQLLQRVSKKTLAAYLGVSRETLSRLQK